ncbi:ADP-ribosylglycohydrolase family protein, partial [candidate division GN15 bacterium]|nr:ADP-ribosylglycohydrolase family protein [candidate division GN15 bacterium]
MPIPFDKFLGCFLGQCVGDALGHPVEGCGSDDCLDYLDGRMKPLWYEKAVSPGFGFGQYTDDSQMARELLASLTEYPKFDGNDYARRLRPLFEQHLVIGPGLACTAAMYRIAAGTPWQEAGCEPPQAGNGTAMRAAPVGMLLGNRPGEMIRVARQQGWITHRDLRCDAGSIAIAGAVSLALRGQCEPETFCSQLADWMSEADREFAEFVNRVPMFIADSPEEALP